MSSSAGFPKAGAPNESVAPVVRNIFDFTAESLGQLKTWLEQNPPSIPVTQILGFSQFTVQLASGAGATPTVNAGTTYGPSATGAPAVTGLSPGKYVVLFGMLGSTGAAGGLPAQTTVMQLYANGSLQSNTAQCKTLDPTSATTATALSLSDANSSLTTQFTATNATGTNAVATFAQPWLIALRYANQ